MRALYHVLGLAMLVCLACDGSEPTQVVVTVLAEPRVREQATQLHVKVRRGADPSVNDIYDATHPARFPYVIALSPENPSTPSAYRLEVSATGASGALASASLESSYVSHQTRYVLLTLEDECVGVVCSEHLTCHAGACIDSRVDPSELAADRTRAPRSVDLVDVTTPSTAADASTDSGTKPTDAGGPRQPEAGAPRIPAAEGGPVVAPAIDAGDSTVPSEAGTAPASSPEAGQPAQDAGSSIERPEAGASDAAPPVVPVTPPPVVPVTPPPVVPDAGPAPATPCKPMGSWVVEYTETGGNCRLGDFNWLVAFHGKLTDIMVGEAHCAKSVDLTPDGCAMTYILSCPAKDQTDAYEETSTLRMIGPDRMVGEVDQLFHRADGDCRTLGKNELKLVP